ncbi:uncharacterized protein LOC106151792 [Lingula anatina]|uniref:Uncharacterized protein LOC106151792 n=1 Tax=Lingula anatina TaxID=7574 RepID=A0A1S3H3S6_LINAN|nr:uncharacterized protein LOC106151792 [Lingula anatina]|eukprot:XP_013380658.1 uncharacterized protein LOC106151792 [Lingula anatina]
MDTEVLYSRGNTENEYFQRPKKHKIIPAEENEQVKRIHLDNQDSTEDRNAIAIVGVGCRFPGADNLDDFWKVLCNGENHVVDIPKDRWDNDLYYDSDRLSTGKTCIKKAGFIKNYEWFDNDVYGINDEEAKRMDPQQRWVLDCCYMALENAGIPLETVRDSNTGVYIGSMNDDFKDLMQDPETMNEYSVTGASSSILSARVSYVFGLRGPSMTIDTACSSSLVAINAASNALQNGDCDMVLCGGVSCILNPYAHIALSKSGMVSPTGQCKAFTAEADGYARGEGCGIVVLKRLKDALENNDNIWALVSSVVNQDGSTAHPMTSPSKDQQMALFRKLKDRQSIDPDDVQYVEAHGTGTQVGDFTEANSIGQFFERGKRQLPSITIGSVKTNIGHLESAAGVAGLIKVLLMMKHGLFVPSLHFKDGKPNPKIPFKDLGLRVSTEMTSWNFPNDQRRMAFVNSFGFGGTNAAALVKQFELPEAPSTCNELAFVAKDSDPPLNTPGTEVCKQNGSSSAIGLGITGASIPHKVICISANSVGSLRRSANEIIDDITNKCLTDQDLDMLMYTSTCRRTHHRVRLATVTTSVKDLRDKLSSCLKRQFHVERKKVRVIYLFSGVATTWKGMCHQLLMFDKVFSAKMSEIDKILTPKTGWSVLNKLVDQEDVSDPEVEPIVIFACQVCLVALWRHWGIEPHAVVGQSVGEVAAFYCAGVMSLEEAAHIICTRTKHVSKAGKGQMMVVENFATEKLKPLLQNKFNGAVEISIFNSLMSNTVSGSPEHIRTLKEILGEQHYTAVNTIDLPVHIAYHSQHMEAAGQNIAFELKDMTLGTAHKDMRNTQNIALYSTVTGRCLETDDHVPSSYWRENVRCPVLMSEAIGAALQEECTNVVLEIGPRPVFGRFIDQFENANGLVVLQSMKKGLSAEPLLLSLAEMYEKGVNPLWNKIVSIPVALRQKPRHHFDSKANIIHTRTARERQYGMHHSSHPYIRRMPGPSPEYVATINKKSTPFIYDHVMVGAGIVVPAAFYVDVALTAVSELSNRPPAFFLLQINFLEPLFVSRDSELDVHVVFEFDEAHKIGKDVYPVAIKDNKKTFAEGKIVRKDDIPKRTMLDICDIESRCTTNLPVDQIYDGLHNAGFHYGSSMKCITDFLVARDECISAFEIPQHIIEDMYRTSIHPSVLDSVMQTVGVLCSDPLNDQRQVTKIIPVSIGSISVLQKPSTTMKAYCRMMCHRLGKAHFNCSLLSVNGDVIAELRNCVMKLFGKNTPENFLGHLTWDKVNSDRPYAKHQSKGIVFIDRNSAVAWMEGGLSFPECSEEEELKNWMERNLSSHLQHSKYIVYAWGAKTTSDEEMDTQEMFEGCQRACTGLRLLMKILIEMQITIPVIVLTVSCQSISFQDFQGTPHFSPFGAQLWGMVRCFLKEETYEKISLVDLFSGSPVETETLRCYLEDPDSFVENHPEIVIKEDSVYKPSLTKAMTDLNYARYRKNVAEEGCPVRLVSSDPNGYSELRFQHQARCNNEPIDPGDVKVDVHHAFLHQIKGTPATISEYDNPCHLRYMSQSGDHGVISYTLVGKVADDNRKSDLSNGDEIFTCCLSPVESFVHVPKECVVLSRLIPRDVVPIFPVVHLAKQILDWCIKHAFPGSQCLILVHNDDNSPLVQVLTDMARVAKFNIESLSKHALSKSVGLQSCQTVLVMTEITRSEIVQLGKVFSQAQCLLFFEEFIQSNKYRALQRSFPNAQKKRFSIYDQLLMHQLRAKVPMTVEWLCTYSADLALNYELKQFVLTNQSPNMRFEFGNETVANTRMDICKDTHAIYIISIPQSGDVFAPKNRLFRSDSCYVVIGGLTGLGRLITECLAKHKAGVIATISRSDPTADQLRERRDLEIKHQVTIFHEQADVSNYTSISCAFERLAQRKIPIKGIFHGAAVLADGAFVNQNQDTFERAIAPKIKGSWNLHKLSINLHLDYFVMHSSVASLLGNPGQTNYGAGNAFMDSLAHYRRQHHLPAQSINWGALNLGLLNQNPNTEQRLRKEGINALNEEDTLECFLHALLCDDVQAMYADIPFKTNNKNLPSTDETDSPEDTLKIEQIRDLPIGDRKQYIKHWVMRTAGTILMDPNTMDENRPLSDLGFDSLNMMSFIRKVKDQFQVSLTPAVLMSSDQKPTTFADLIERFIGVGFQRHSPHSPDRRIQKPAFTHRYMLNSQGSKEDLGNHIIVKIRLPEQSRAGDVALWQNIIRILSEENPTLRMRYRGNGELETDTIEFLLNDPLEVQCIDGTEDSMEQSIKEIMRSPFNSFIESPWRVAFVNTTPPIVLFVFHHIAVDVDSMRIMFQDHVLPYLRNASAGIPLTSHLGKVSAIPSLAEALDRHLTEEEKARLKVFWKNILPKKVPLVQVSTKALPECTFGKSLSVTGQIGDDLIEDLFRWRDSDEFTPFQFICSIYQLLLHATSQIGGFVISASVNMRVALGMEGVMTNCENILPIPVHFESHSQTFREFLRTNKNIIRECCVENAICPPELIYDEMPQEQVENIGKHLIIYHRSVIEEDNPQLGGAVIEHYLLDFYRETKLEVIEAYHPKRIELKFQGSCDLLDGETIHILMRRLIALVEATIRNPDHTLETLIENARA